MVQVSLSCGQRAVNLGGRGATWQLAYLDKVDRVHGSLDDVRRQLQRMPYHQGGGLVNQGARNL